MSIPPMPTRGDAVADWSDTLLAWTLEGCVVVIMICMLMCLFRLLRGPHMADRAVSLDTIGVTLIGFVLIFSIRQQTLVYFDSVLVLSLLSFAGAVAMSQYIARRNQRNEPTIVEEDAS